MVKADIYVKTASFFNSIFPNLKNRHIVNAYYLLITYIISNIYKLNRYEQPIHMDTIL